MHSVGNPSLIEKNLCWLPNPQLPPFNVELAPRTMSHGYNIEEGGRGWNVRIADWKTQAFNKTVFVPGSDSASLVHDCRLLAIRFFKKIAIIDWPFKLSKISTFILGLLSSLFYLILLLYHNWRQNLHHAMLHDYHIYILTISISDCVSKISDVLYYEQPCKGLVTKQTTVKWSIQSQLTLWDIWLYNCLTKLVAMTTHFLKWVFTVKWKYFHMLIVYNK